MQTPISIVPEWYLLPFYAILRSIPNKLLGVISMFASLLILLVLPLTDTSKIRTCAFKPFHKFLFWIFVGNFCILTFIGSMHVEDPYIIVGQISTVLYFSYFLIILPISGIIDNTLYDLISK
jgi:ubiquinol-cytochrome c reductase cytochrome b subunit